MTFRTKLLFLCAVLICLSCTTKTHKLDNDNLDYCRLFTWQYFCNKSRCQLFQQSSLLSQRKWRKIKINSILLNWKCNLNPSISNPKQLSLTILILLLLSGNVELNPGPNHLNGLLFEQCYAGSVVPRHAYSDTDLIRKVRQSPFDFLTKPKPEPKVNTDEEASDQHVGAQGGFKVGLSLFDGLTFKGDGAVDYGSKSAEKVTGSMKNRQGGGFLFPGLPIIGLTENRDRVPRDVSAVNKGNLKRHPRNTHPFVCHGNIFDITCIESDGKGIKRSPYGANRNDGTLIHPF